MKQYRLGLFGSATSVIFLVCTNFQAARAQSGMSSMSFQAVLNAADGQPLPDGSYNLTFSFYSNVVGSAVIGTTNAPN